MATRGLFIDGRYLLPAGEAQFSSENRYMQEGNAAENNSNANSFPVDDLFDFSTEDEVMTDGFVDTVTGDSSTVTGVDSCNSSVSGGSNFDGNISCRSFTATPFPAPEISLPYDDLAELEWLSNFYEESFSSEELQNLQLISATTAAAAAAANNNITPAGRENIMDNNYFPPAAFPSVVSVPSKARSKRSRASSWPFRLLHLSSSGSNGSIDSAAVAIPGAMKKRENSETLGRKCLHCASDKTPQWRTGPLGPKTLCNACGVRYKSGRLFPEYRPAASPTFESTKHSNSHRKVVELRMEKELQGQQQPPLMSQASIFCASKGGEDYLPHHNHQECGCLISGTTFSALSNKQPFSRE